ncbi:hypothetical protein O181_048971 [Austropuccinia psidii MF-1]|uniref:Uncharacterized protein n=1 Tax=Austropuccinia psidii MF-1 TaxID=1389203 RepID=A0A9Q3DZ02_9BASI|nr:hypothetical protein [Austropuccinia psidii MF-1]
MGPLGPCWPKSNECKGGQPPTLKARWAHLNRFWPPISTFPEMTKRTSGPKLAIFNPWPLATTRGHQLKFRKDSPSPMYSIPRIQAWCICGIIYHYAPILLRNPTVMFSGPNYAIPIQVPKSITHFEGSLFSHSLLQSLAATRRPFKDPNHLALQELDFIFFSGLLQG